MKTPTITNLLGEPVYAGDIVAITTTSGKRSRTRIAKVERIMSIQYDRWDHANNVKIPSIRYRTFVKLYKVVRKYDRDTRSWSDPSLVPYVKEVFGIKDSVPININSLSPEILEVLK